MSLDKLSLDALVQGRSHSAEDWKALIKHSERERLWIEAIKRRENLDRFCYFAANWPQLVSYYQQAKRFVKCSPNSPTISLFSDLDPMRALLSTLNDKEVEQEPLLANVEWGSQQLIEICGKKIVSFNSESQVRIHYRYAGSEGWITSDDNWEFLPDEGAVEFIIIDVDVVSDNLEENLNNSKSVSYIVFLPSLK